MDSRPIRVLAAGQEHLAKVYALFEELEAMNVEHNSFAKAYEQNLVSEEMTCLVALQGAEVIGFASFKIRTVPPRMERVGELREIIVAKWMRRYGVGRLLFSKVEQMAQEKGCARLEVCPDVNRGTGRRFYERQGMEELDGKFILGL